MGNNTLDTSHCRLFLLSLYYTLSNVIYISILYVGSMNIVAALNEAGHTWADGRAKQRLRLETETQFQQLKKTKTTTKLEIY